MKKRLLSILLTLCMVLMLVPTTAFAEETGSLAITVDGFEVGKTPNDCTVTVESTIPGVTFDEDDITYIGWDKYVLEAEFYEHVAETDVFETGVRYQCRIQMDNNGLELAPAVTVNGITPTTCRIIITNNQPFAIVIFCEFGTPPEPVPTITIDGPDVVCAEQDYEFSATASEGVTLDKKFGHDTGYSGSDIELTIDENGVGHGVVPAAYYEPAANGFDVIAHGTTANGTPVSTTKHVEVSPEHIYVDGVCGCGAVQQYTITYDGGEGVEGSIGPDTKTHGVPVTLSGETFKMDGFIQTGWVDKETGAIYKLAATYDEDRDATLYPYWEKLITLTAPFTTTVALGDAGEPGETIFELGLIDSDGYELTFDDQYIGAEITTDGAGSYSGTMTITATE